MSPRPNAQFCAGYYYPQMMSILKFYKEFVAKRRPCEKGDRKKALEYLSKVSSEDFDKMCAALESNLPRKAFLDYPLKVDDILNAFSGVHVVPY